MRELSRFEQQELTRLVTEFLTKREKSGGKRSWTVGVLVYEVTQFVMSLKMK